MKYLGYKNVGDEPISFDDEYIYFYSPLNVIKVNRCVKFEEYSTQESTTNRCKFDLRISLKNLIVKCLTLIDSSRPYYNNNYIDLLMNNICNLYEDTVATKSIYLLDEVLSELLENLKIVEVQLICKLKYMYDSQLADLISITREKITIVNNLLGMIKKKSIDLSADNEENCDFTN
jgi:hypothetical protein